MSSRVLRRVMIAIAVLGLARHDLPDGRPLRRDQVLCSSKGNPCEAVQTSVYSKVLGIPVALLGLIGYVGILGALLAPDTEYSRIATLALTLFGFGFSGVPDLPRGLHAEGDLRVVREQRDHADLPLRARRVALHRGAVPAARVAAVEAAAVQQHAHGAREDAGIQRE